MKIQADITEQHHATLKASQEAMVYLIHLDRYKALLHNRASDFIVRDYKEITELEELKRHEAEEKDCLKKERSKDEQKECKVRPSHATTESNQYTFNINR